jgi:hypothetical protein
MKNNEIWQIKKMLVFKKDLTCFHQRETYPSGDLPGGDTGAIFET